MTFKFQIRFCKFISSIMEVCLFCEFIYTWLWNYIIKEMIEFKSKTKLNFISVDYWDSLIRQKFRNYAMWQYFWITFFLSTNKKSNEIKIEKKTIKLAKKKQLGLSSYANSLSSLFLFQSSDFTPLTLWRKKVLKKNVKCNLPLAKLGQIKSFFSCKFWLSTRSYTYTKIYCSF